MFPVRKLATFLFAVMALLLAALPARAQLLPCEAITLVVPWNAGGATDVLFRIIAERYNAAGHTPALKVRNVAGSRGLTGSRLVAKSRPDGCTMLAAQDLVTLANLTGDVEFGLEAFETVARVATTPLIIGSNGNAGFSRADGIEPIVKASSKPLIVAGHPGTTDYFVLLAFSQAIGIVPEFRTFQSPRRMVRALIDGEVALAEVSPGAAKAAVADGTFRVLGVTANQRLSELPSVPTLEEQGVGFVYNIERGLFAPAGTPSAIREAIAGNIAAILADPGLETILAEKITRPAYLGPAEFAARLAKSVEAWRTVADRAGLLKR
jgi:tripartite-type tricarboxylate transporter receptor subunit TctC